MFDYSPAAIMSALEKARACADAMYPCAADECRDEHAQDAWDNHIHMLMAASFPGWLRKVTKPTTLEQSLLALMDEHNLTSISVGMIRGSDGKAFPNCYAQGDGLCGSAGHNLPLADEVAAAIAELNAKRGAAPIAELPALVIGEAA